MVGWMLSLNFVAGNCVCGSFKTWGMCLGWLVAYSWVGNHLMKSTGPLTSSRSAIPRSMVQANHLRRLDKNGYGMKVDCWHMCLSCDYGTPSGQAKVQSENVKKKTYSPQPRSVLEVATTPED